MAQPSLFLEDDDENDEGRETGKTMRKLTQEEKKELGVFVPKSPFPARMTRKH